MQVTVSKVVARNLLEFVLLFALWRIALEAIAHQWLPSSGLFAALLAAAAVKTAFFGVENISQLRSASDENMPYHKYLLLMLINVWQVITSFALDFHALHMIAADSFGSINPRLESGSLVFEFFYYSALNFMFFGYGDITPQTVPAKVMTLTEISLAFVTVIFLLIRLHRSERVAAAAARRSLVICHTRILG